MRELDTRTQENLDDVEQLQRHYAALARKNGKSQDEEEASSLVDRIRQEFQECIDIADEKVRHLILHALCPTLSGRCLSFNV